MPFKNDLGHTICAQTSVIILKRNADAGISPDCKQGPALHLHDRQGNIT